MATRPGAIRLAAGIIVLAALAIYANSLCAPFVFDDDQAIVNNPTIRHLWQLAVLQPPADGAGVQGRPLINLTLAINYALGGTNVWGYHLFNILVHAAAGLVLFGIVRRTLRQRGLSARWGPVALPLALAVAGLWVVHPLQTESVTCTVQRTETVMALCYLLTLYGFIRGTDPKAAHSRRWLGVSVLACLLGMAAKEVMVTAPLIVLLYDRIFVAGTFGEAWHRRRGFYGALAATWLVLAWLVLEYGGHRGGAAGFGLGVTWWTYALTQCYAVVHYIRLVFWPHPLIVDYGYSVVEQPWKVALQAMFLLLLLRETVLALRRGAPVGFAGAWFFLILAPSSSVVPLVSQTIAEHRMYLPLAAILALAILGIYSWLGRRSFVIFVIAGLILGGLTIQRNRDYRAPDALWSDTIAKCPSNARAYYNLGDSYGREGRYTEAIPYLEQAARLAPKASFVHSDLGACFVRVGRFPQAIRECCRAAELDCNDVGAFENLATALLKYDRTEEVVAQFVPDNAIKRQIMGRAYYSLGSRLALADKTDEAIGYLQDALQADPEHVSAHNNLGVCLVKRGRVREAIPQFRETIRLDSNHLGAYKNLAAALMSTGQTEEAIATLWKALRINPDDADMHNSLGEDLLKANFVAEAKTQFAEALRLKPDFADAREHLAELSKAAKTTGN